MALVRAPYAPIRTPVALTVGAELKVDAGMLRSLDAREVNVSEAFTIVDATGTFFRASLKLRDEKSGRAVAYEKMPRSPESPAHITLVCPVLGRQRMLTVCQKATELGVARIVPVVSDHSVQRDGIEHEKPWAWKGQCIKAARQCRRGSLPELTEVISFNEALSAPFWAEASQRFALDDRSPIDHDPFAPTSEPPAPSDVVLVVGPEGGFSDPERARLDEHHAIVLALGGRVLRAETAVYVGLTVLQHRMGDLRA
ncbi:MAG: 16S rRNA (uracil(1498)-N(3))-methyltransferase [Myxococcales bacterium]|nr:16S rRNA (uracil(1498)-N(3))-methyltransferase [Myxococcales bacterium]